MFDLHWSHRSSRVVANPNEWFSFSVTGAVLQTGQYRSIGVRNVSRVEILTIRLRGGGESPIVQDVEEIMAGDVIVGNV